jgi:hypothetical protein
MEAVAEMSGTTGLDTGIGGRLVYYTQTENVRHFEQ